MKYRESCTGDHRDSITEGYLNSMSKDNCRAFESLGDKYELSAEECRLVHMNSTEKKTTAFLNNIML